jgi:hypothetical protein
MFKCESFYNFCESEQDAEIDGILLTFESNEDKFSYIEKNSEGNIIRTAEKQVIGTEAICGCYCFKNKHIFKKYSTKIHSKTGKNAAGGYIIFRT